MFENFLLSGFTFDKSDDFLRFKFKVVNSIALIVTVFSLIFAILSDLGINELGEIHTNANYIYACSAILSILYLRFSKTNLRVSSHLLLIASLATFSSALIFVVQDEFRIIWFYLLVYTAYILVGSTYGILYTIASVLIIFLSNYFFNLELSEIAIVSAGLGLVIGSLLSLIYTKKITEYQSILYSKNRKLEILSSIDGLTGILNKRVFDEMMSELLLASKNKQESFSLLLLDLDYFKKINDKYGHAVGDEVLVSFTYIIKLILRKKDTFARVGGGEFAIILKQTSKIDTICIAQKICQEVARQEIYITSGSVRVSTSIGVSMIEREDTNSKDIYHRSDRALYKAKDEGRNKVCIL